MTLVTRDTRLIKLDTEEYPLFLDDFRSRTGAVIGTSIDSEALVEFGYAPVLEVPRPDVGDVITEGAPEEVEGQWRRVWVVRDYNAEEAAVELQQAKATALYGIEQFRIAQFKIGFPHLFNNGDDMYHIQVRDQDRVNILARYTKAKEAIEAGLLDKQFEFRVWENVSVFLTPQEMVDMADAADEQVEAGYRAVWALKGQIEAAATVEEIPALPDSLFSL
jgi:endonuclease YncB( thermonuclease family)